MNDIQNQIRTCNICKDHLPEAPRPIFQFAQGSRILLIGQAPGRKAHDSQIPWNDRSGETLRSWLGVSTQQFYDTDLFAIVPMGLCYPGRASTGDLPPRPECAKKWHGPIRTILKHIDLTLLVGHYAQRYYLPSPSGRLTDNVQSFEKHLPTFFPLPHPSPRNQIWLRRNPWFEHEVIPRLKNLIVQFTGISKKSS